jgi:hypothetical protein
MRKQTKSNQEAQSRQTEQTRQDQLDAELIDIAFAGAVQETPAAATPAVDSRPICGSCGALMSSRHCSSC